MGSNNEEPVVIGQSSGTRPNVTASQAHGPVVVVEEKNEAEKFEEYMKKYHNLPDFEIYDQELLPEVEFNSTEFDSLDSAPKLFPDTSLLKIRSSLLPKRFSELRWSIILSIPCLSSLHKSTLLQVLLLHAPPQQLKSLGILSLKALKVVVRQLKNV
ncbi:OLC1v1010362C1 [Oldenlandia corymbosa var. corymbosa]|uniref:OLC1v1010362C1 n=1 Tax=Oldenlandia corymbosa var. corymbosa TaxID=529605 RepID=A0AAV1DU63_OLDCO|nr:OLC1v1010362C1 [Oldenlandia corymbosa var. corymbosa]